ncbi:hypothetical protein ACFV84_37350 [Kitasatospora sp. NPDC059811]|uniref:hypothetical protein n=1 Tax=Kitasatospora sp. NPDC059811 TaxID=3346957 RepID=UPI0036581D72
MEKGSEKVVFHVTRSESTGAVSGTLSWDGAGSFTFDGGAQTDCNPQAFRTTAWLEYGGEHQSWSKSKEEADCTGRNFFASNWQNIKVSGRLPRGEKLELRANTWQNGRIGTWKASEKKVFTIS